MSKDNITDIHAPAIDPEELAAMETEAEKTKAKVEAAGGKIGMYVHKFETPLIYDGNPIKELTFDFDSLTGQDVFDIDNELEALGVNVAVRELNGHFQLTYCVKACKENVGVDIFALMRVPDFLAISRQVKTFLLLAK